jgi:peptidoglycan/LPS O-acetylase OafA/YrhL
MVFAELSCLLVVAWIFHRLVEQPLHAFLDRNSKEKRVKAD